MSVIKHARRPVVSTLGIVSRDETLLIDRYPAEGSFTAIADWLVTPGGTTGNIATGLARLGAEVRIFSKVGDDEWGVTLVHALAAEGVDVGDVVTAPGQSDRSLMLVSSRSHERTIFWDKGPSLTRGDRIDVDRLFRADLTVIDAPDVELVRFLTDLPAHTFPKARLLGTLSYLADVVARDTVEVACRFDVLVGNEREYCLATGESTPESALQSVASRMPGTNLRTAVMTRGERGAIAATERGQVQVDAHSANVVDTTGAGDAFAAGLAHATALRWNLVPSLRLASAVASFAVEVLGAQTALPTFSAAMDRAGIVWGCDRDS